MYMHQSAEMVNVPTTTTIYLSLYDILIPTYGSVFCVICISVDH